MSGRDNALRACPAKPAPARRAWHAHERSMVVLGPARASLRPSAQEVARTTLQARLAGVRVARDPVIRAVVVLLECEAQQASNSPTRINQPKAGRRPSAWCSVVDRFVGVSEPVSDVSVVWLKFT